MPIQDESVVNSWHVFKANDYKVIAENKGDITNIVSIGTYLLVHCEHSLFLFNNDNTLKNNDKSLQFSPTDIFDMGYIELFTSQKGYAGLQDKDSWIVGDFGYIFYDKSALTIYRFDEGKLTTISDDINWFMFKYRPNRVVMTFDNMHNRILMCFLGSSDTPIATMSYSTDVSSFISIHNIFFLNAAYTKEGTYIYNKAVAPTAIAKFRLHTISNNYGDFYFNDAIYPNYLDSYTPGIITDDSNANNFVAFYVDIICNSFNGNNIDLALKLDSIRFSCEKYNVTETPRNPVEEGGERFPFSGNYVTAYSDAKGQMAETDISTVVLNPLDKDNWKKTMYDKGYFTFSHFRFDPLPGKAITSDNMRYVYGKYIVVRFIFKNADANIRVKLDSLSVNVTPYK
jgi:hypothetical protein